MKLANYKLITLSLVGFTACSGLVLASTKSYADNDSATDEVNITVPVACTMTGTIATGQEHTATLQPGTYSGASGSAYENGIGKTTLATFCNDYNGFSIYAIGFTDDTEGNNTLLGTSTSGGATISTKVYASGDTTSSWSMKVTKVTDSSATFNPANMNIANSFDSWHTVPDDYAKVAEYHASTGSSATDQSLGAKVETTYASYISTSQPADTYTGKVKYVMVHPYNTPAPYKKAYMQDLTSATIAQLLPNIHDTIKVIDKRDRQEYAIAKLADGRYWMTENLNIAGGTALSSDDTDFDPSYELPTTGNWNVSNDGKLILPASAIKNPDSDNLTDNTQFSIDNYAYVFNSGNTENCGDSSRSIPCYSYYSWDTATLGSGRGLSTMNTNAPYSICPKGWRLPISSQGSDKGWKRGDYYALATAYNVGLGEYAADYTPTFYNNLGPNTMPNFQSSGEYSSSVFHSTTSGSGSYSSSTSDSDTTNAFLNFSNNGVIINYFASRSTGLSIRCLFKTD